jgi:hypothetical protein
MKHERMLVDWKQFVGANKIIDYKPICLKVSSSYQGYGS